MSKLLLEIKSKNQALKNQIISWRRHLHAHPELSFQEFETADYIEARLREIGIDAIQTKAQTGKVLEIQGKYPGKTVALRADIDALPIIEKSDKGYKSTKEGVMHACGHDVHTASLLGAAAILYSIREKFAGTIRLIFQPGEEKVPGGASKLIAEGVLEGPKPFSMFGQHVMPELEVGKIGICKGYYMASVDELYFTIKGKGGHAAMPHLLKDPVLAASHLIVGLQQIVSRHNHPKNPAVLSIGKVIANGAHNIIPEEVQLDGTLRSMDQSWRAYAKDLIRKVSKELVNSMGCEVEVNIEEGYPSLYNEPELSKRFWQAAVLYIGEERVVDLEIWLAAEDFAYYGEHLPACFYRLGTGNTNLGTTNALHTPSFDVDEEVFSFSSGLLVWAALCELDHSLLDK